MLFISSWRRLADLPAGILNSMLRVYQDLFCVSAEPWAHRSLVSRFIAPSSVK